MLRAPESLTTSRLRLRRPVAADAAAIFTRYASDPAVTRFLAWPTHRSLADTHAFLALSDGEWSRWPASAYLIELLASEQLLGSTGLTFESATVASTGYVLARDAWGCGYATEALRAMVALAASLGVQRLYAFCHPEHRPSQRVLEKGGLKRDPGMHAYPGFPNLPASGPCEVLRYSRAFSKGSSFDP